MPETKTQNLSQAPRSSSGTPEHVSINPQRIGFEFNEQVPRYWANNSPMLSHTMNAFSVLFPKGEKFFVDAVRAYRDRVEDPKLLEEVRGFIGQEAMHSLEHISLNQHIRDQGMPVDDMEKHLEAVLNLVRKLPARHQLAATCALEHMTAMMANILLERDDVRDDMHESMRPLWVWHAIEETEHKAVTFDVYQQVGGNYPERVFYLAAGTAALGIMTTYFAGRMMLKDRKNLSLKDTASGLWRLWGKGGVFSSLAPTWLEYFKPGFHPWDHDNSQLIGRFKDSIQAHIAPKYRKGTAPTLQ